MEEQEIMTIEEVAKLLRVSDRTVYDWANKGEIPCGKLGTVWRFKREEIGRWLDARLGGRQEGVEPRPLGLQHLIVRERVMVLDVHRKVDALNQMIENLATAPQVKSARELAEAIFRREDMMSTGIGMQVAVPHVRLRSVSDLVMTAAVSRRDIPDYESLDGKPVRILLMIAARTDQHAQHLKTLSAISTLIKNPAALDALLKVEEPDSLFALLAEGEMQA